MLTVYFDDPYWVGVLEEERDGYLFAARYIFGAEPSDQEIYDFVQHEYLALHSRMTAGVRATESILKRTINPKRMQREVRRTLQEAGVSSKAHEAMRLQQEVNKKERQQSAKADRDAHKAYKRVVAQQKAKAKHRGH